MGKITKLWQIGRMFGARAGTQRLSYELQRGTGLMSSRMRAVHGWDHWDLQHIAPGASPDEILTSRLQGGHPFFFADSRSLALQIEKVAGRDGVPSIQEEAGKILRGTLPYFGRLSFACGFPPNWFQNPVTGQRVSPNRPWTGMRFASDDYGDLKFILEPSRFLFVYPLARAYAITGDDRFAEAFWTALEDWARHSPPMSGPLWICGQESSLRILALSFGLYAFLRSLATTSNRAAQLLSIIAAHAWRTEQTIGYARSQRSNHLFSEAVALWTAGILYPELRDAVRWRKLGATLLSEAVADQITPQGAFQQHSFNYQRMVLHLLLWTLRLAEIHQVALDPEIRTRTSACLDFLSTFVDRKSVRAPNYGSNDGTNILPLSTCEYSDYRPLLQLGASVLGQQSKLGSGPWDEPSIWIGNAASAARAAAPARPHAANSGYFRIGGENSWAMVRAGFYTRRPVQADQLHVDLWHDGVNIACDAGTYLYNGDPPWNNGLAGTAVHNTVMVDGQDQMSRAGRFLWLDWAQASGRSFSTSPERPSASESLDSFEREHNGYRRLGVTHRRAVHCLDEGAWVIVDDLLGTGQHGVRLHWLTPDLPFEIVSLAPFAVAFKGERSRLHWQIVSSAVGDAAIIREGKRVTQTPIGDDEPLLGWESPTYGERRAAVSLIYCVRAVLPLRLITTVLVDESIQIRTSPQVVELWRGNSRILKISTVPDANRGTNRATDGKH